MKAYFYGWFIFWRAIAIQAKKKHGAGRPEWRYMLLVARQARWIVYGQHRRR